jgi:hypothetical protein
MTETSIAANLDAPRLPAPEAPSETPVAPDPARAAMRQFYLTSDLRAATGLPRTHMDFYLREGLIQPTARTESGYLLFDERELETLRAILRWRRHGIGLREIRQRLGRNDG